jgi:hypothetical protein
MAFENEADRQKASNGEPATRVVRTEADRLMAYQDSNIYSSGGCAMILLGLPLLLFPPVGITFIILGIVGFVLGVRRLKDANPQ